MCNSSLHHITLLPTECASGLAPPPRSPPQSKIAGPRDCRFRAEVIPMVPKILGVEERRGQIPVFWENGFLEPVPKSIPTGRRCTEFGHHAQRNMDARGHSLMAFGDNAIDGLDQAEFLNHRHRAGHPPKFLRRQRLRFLSQAATIPNLFRGAQIHRFCFYPAGARVGPLAAVFGSEFNPIGMTGVR